MFKHHMDIPGLTYTTSISFDLEEEPKETFSTEEETTKYEDFIDDCIRLLSPDKIEGIMAKFREQIKLFGAFSGFIKLWFDIDTNNPDGKSAFSVSVFKHIIDKGIIRHTRKYLYCEHCDVVYICDECIGAGERIERVHDCTTHDQDNDDVQDDDIDQDDGVDNDDDQDDEYDMSMFDFAAERIVRLSTSGMLRAMLCDFSYMGNLDADEIFEFNLCEMSLEDSGVEMVNGNSIIQMGKGSEKSKHKRCDICSKCYTTETITKYSKEEFKHCCKCFGVWTSMRNCVLTRTISYTHGRKCPYCSVSLNSGSDSDSE